MKMNLDVIWSIIVQDAEKKQTYDFSMTHEYDDQKARLSA